MVEDTPSKMGLQYEKILFFFAMSGEAAPFVDFLCSSAEHRKSSTNGAGEQESAVPSHDRGRRGGATDESESWVREDHAFYHCYSFPNRKYRDTTLEIVVVVAPFATAYGVDSVGTTPAAVAVALALERFAPDLVINAGTCGGLKKFSPELQVGDTFLCTEFCTHDRRIPLPAAAGAGGGDKNFPGVKGAVPPRNCPYGLGELRSPERLKQALLSACGSLDERTAAGDEVDPAARPQGGPRSQGGRRRVRMGICSTGNSLDCVDRDYEIMCEQRANVKEMEAHAVAWVCAHHTGTLQRTTSSVSNASSPADAVEDSSSDARVGVRAKPQYPEQEMRVPFFAVKTVTDVVDKGEGNAADQFEANFAIATRELQARLRDVLEVVVRWKNEQ